MTTPSGSPRRGGSGFRSSALPTSAPPPPRHMRFMLSWFRTEIDEVMAMRWQTGDAVPSRLVELYKELFRGQEPTESTDIKESVLKALWTENNRWAGLLRSVTELSEQDIAYLLGKLCDNNLYLRDEELAEWARLLYPYETEIEPAWWKKEKPTAKVLQTKLKGELRYREKFAADVARENVIAAYWRRMLPRIFVAAVACMLTLWFLWPDGASLSNKDVGKVFTWEFEDGEGEKHIKYGAVMEVPVEGGKSEIEVGEGDKKQAFWLIMARFGPVKDTDAALVKNETAPQPAASPAPPDATQAPDPSPAPPEPTPVPPPPATPTPVPAPEPEPEAPAVKAAPRPRPAPAASNTERW